MSPFVRLILLAFISATDKIVISNCQSTDVDSGKGGALELLLLQVKSNFDELRSEVQSLKRTMDIQLEMIGNLRKDQQVQRALFGNMTDRMNDVIKQTSEQSRSDHQDLLQRLTAMINMSTATTILRLGEHNSHIQQQTAQRLDVVEKMLLRTNATDQCEAFDKYREALNDFNRSIQWVRSGVDHLTTTSGRRRLVSIQPVESQALSAGTEIVALTVMNNELYVGRWGQSVIEVYDVATFASRRNVSIPGLSCVHDLASCPQCDVVYISEWCQNRICAVDKRGVVVFSWSAMGWPHGLSVNSQFNVIVTFPNLEMLREFSPRGELIRDITLQSDMMYPWHAIQLDHDRYAVVHGEGDGLNRVCVVNRNGTIIESYGRDKGSGVGRLDKPWRMLIFGGSIIVADQYNKRVLLFSVSPLQYTRELISTYSQGLQPYRMAISEDGTRLFVSYYSNHLKTFNLTWI